MSSAQKPQSEEHPLQSQVVDPLIEFSKDSVKLLNKCHRPDLKGTFVCLLRLGRQVRSGWELSFSVLACRISSSSICYGSWTTSARIPRILCQIDSHPH